MRIGIGRGLGPSVERMASRITAELGPGIDAVPGTLAIGVDDPMLPGADARRPLAVIPAVGPRVTAWGEALVAAADAVILFDPGEAQSLAGALVGRAVTLAGLAAPRLRAPAPGFDPGDAPEDLRRAMEGRETLEGAGIAWVSGRGLARLTDALEAWAAGRAVVVLPGTDDHEIFRRGRALRPRSGAEAVEATRFLMDNPALAQALGARGRHLAASLPSPRQVALRVLEGVELARQSAAEGAR